MLVFGSWSSPAFRDRGEALRKLAKQHDDHAEFLVVYTKEAHPTGGWEVERNRDDGVSVQQPKDEQGRRELATKARTALKLDKLAFAVDAADDKVAAAYGGFPNAAVVVGRDGKVAFRQEWLDPTGLGPRIEEAARKAR